MLRSAVSGRALPAGTLGLQLRRAFSGQTSGRLAPYTALGRPAAGGALRRAMLAQPLRPAPCGSRQLQSALAPRASSLGTAAMGRSTHGKALLLGGRSPLSPTPLVLVGPLNALGTTVGLSERRAGLATTTNGGAPPPAKWTPAWIYLHGKEMALHYYHGSKLLIADTKIAARLLGRLFLGHRLTRREHNLLVRVLADLSRVIPLAFFLLVPFMEFALPFALRIFPNLLPSTFEEKHHKEEKRKKLLQMRLEIAQVLEHTLEKRASEVRKSEAKAAAEAQAAGEGLPTDAFPEAKGGSKDGSDHVRNFMLRMRQGGRAASPEELLGVMSKFKDNITLDGLQRDQVSL